MPVNHADAVQVLVDAVRRRASDPKVFAYEVAELVPDALRTSGIEEVARAIEETRGGDDEPDAATTGLQLTSARFGARYVLVAPIEDDAFRSGLGRKALLAVARLRANLSTDYDRSDLYLFLVCPPGDVGGPHRQRVLERNEALARTHVWVPPAAIAAWPDAADRFLDRTFLARPAPAGTGPSGDLTPLHTEIQRLVSSGALSEEQALQWEAILSGPESADRVVATELLASMDGDED